MVPEDLLELEAERLPTGLPRETGNPDLALMIQENKRIIEVLGKESLEKDRILRGRQLSVRVFGEGYFLQLEFVIFFGSEVPDSQRGVLIEVGHAGAVQRKEILRITLKIGRVFFERKGSFVVQIEY